MKIKLIPIKDTICKLEDRWEESIKINHGETKILNYERNNVILKDTVRNLIYI